MNAEGSKRLRFGTTKSRNGCLPCKARRVKCGEEKPSCSRCERGGRQCSWASEATCQPANPATQVQRAITLLPETTPRDRQALQYFVVRTSAHLVGPWSSSTRATVITKCAVSDPCIRRVSIALGALQRVHEFGQGCQQYALAQYVTALRMVRDSISQLTYIKEALLLACVLFCAFECMNYHLDSAMSHLSSGHSLVLQHALTAASRTAKGDAGLTSFLLPTLTMLDNDRYCLGAASPSAMAATKLEIPQRFTSVQEAQQLLPSVLNMSYSHLAAVKAGTIPPNHANAIRQATQWCEGLDQWLVLHHRGVSDEEIIDLLPTVAWRILMVVVIQADYTRGEMAWDSMLAEFELVVDCAESFLDLTAELVMEDEPWKHPLAYTDMPTHERARQTLNHQYGGQITEGLLAELLADRPGGTPKSHGISGTPTPESDTPGPLAALLRKSHRLAENRKVAGRARQAFRGAVNIRSTFTLSHGIVYPLFAVGCHCRDPAIRSRALRLLEVCNRHEGLWDSKLAAQSLKRRIMVEATQALNAVSDVQLTTSSTPPEFTLDDIKEARQIPNHCRIRATGRRFLPDGRVLERFHFGWKGSLHDALASGQQERWIELSVDP